MTTGRVLLVMNLQMDFMPSGMMPCLGLASSLLPESDTILPQVKQALAAADTSIFCLAEHPADHIKFAANHPWRKPGQHIAVGRQDILLWPIHAVAGSFGAQPVPGLMSPNKALTLRMGQDAATECMNAFCGQLDNTVHPLSTYLEQLAIKEITLLGCMLDHHLNNTAQTALELGFSVQVLTDASRGLNLQPGDTAAALAQLTAAGAQLCSTQEWITG